VLGSRIFHRAVRRQMSAGHSEDLIPLGSQGDIVANSTHLMSVLTALADPVRLAILQHLMGGGAAVSELVAITGATQPNVSNHLTVLRKRGLVRNMRMGRQQLYELKDARVAQLVESLSSVAGGAQPATVKDEALLKARTCYDHLAGKLGVRLFEALTERGAILLPGPFLESGRAGAGSALALGPNAETTFKALGVSLKDALKGARSPGFACRDWTERKPHLGGKLGAALWYRFMEDGWVVRKPGTRAVVVTPLGRKGLTHRLGIVLP
jgi:DNA-binding transcriptional ArsR family regulator